VLAQPVTEALPDWGKITVPQVTRTSPWIWVVALLMAAAAGIYLLQAMRGRWTKSGVVHR
jgi:hypothetical protein